MKKKLIFGLLFLFCLIQPGNCRAQDSIDLSWMQLPVIPELSRKALDILKAGKKAGTNTRAFSKVGDCDTSTDWYLKDFDLGPTYYNLGQYADQFTPVIQYYAGSFGRKSLTATPGFSAASVLSTYWTDITQCKADELPLECEYRIHNPAVVLISLGTNDGYNPPVFKENLRQIVEATLKENRLPILMTKADNTEGNYSINADIAALAAEYELPLWNFWAAVQSLSNHGLQEDQIHLTFYKDDFTDPTAADTAWYWRNFTALEMLNQVLQAELSLD